MAGEGLVKLLQIAGAALGIPAAAAGTFAAYQNYFSTDVTCQKLRNNIIATMERSVAPETKRSLLRKDVTEFEKLCGEADPDARAIFHAVLAEGAHGAAAAAVLPEPPHPQIPPVGVFGAPGSKEHYGWVALSHRQPGGSWTVHFNGYEILRNIVAAHRHGVELPKDAAGLVGAAVGHERPDQAAKPPAGRRLRARARNTRRDQPAVGRGRARIVLVGGSGLID